MKSYTLEKREVKSGKIEVLTISENGLITHGGEATLRVGLIDAYVIMVD